MNGFLGHTLEMFRPFDTNIEGIFLGPFVTGFLGVLTALRVLFSARARRLGTPSLLRYQIACYLAATAIFGVVRALTEVNRIVLLLAATHNMLEWGIIGALWHVRANIGDAESKAATFFKRAIVWTWLVFLGILYVPKLTDAFLFEEQVGILCDYLLVTIFLVCWYSTHKQSPQICELSIIGIKASVWHYFGQILPLLLIGFGAILPSTGSIIITLTLLPFNYYYHEFALQWDAHRQQQQQQQRPASVPASENKTVAEMSTLPASSEIDEDGRSSPSSSRWKGLQMGFLAAACIVAGLLAIASVSGALLVFGQCPSPRVCAETGPVVGLCRVIARPGREDALRRELANLITPTRAERGNIFYHLMQSPVDPRHFQFMEKWSSRSALHDHLNSDHVVAFFGNKAKQEALVESLNIEPAFQMIGSDICQRNSAAAAAVAAA